jgi:glycosyltransferase involved in cell wall biosynthesis
VGLVNQRKGWRILAEAAERAKSRNLPVRVLLAGSGPGEEVRAANDWCTRFGNGSRYLGLVRDTAPVFAQADAMVLASNHHEGMPMSIIEAFSARVPVIATRVGGIPYMIEDGVQGYLVDRCSEAICDAIHRLATDIGLHASMSRAARRQFVEQFSASKMGRAYERVYALALAPSKTAEARYPGCATI